MVTGKDNPIYDLDLPNGNLKNSDFKMTNTVGGETYYSMILLIDRNKKVRGLYQGDQTPQIESLRKDLRKLFIEYKTIDKEKKSKEPKT